MKAVTCFAPKTASVTPRAVYLRRPFERQRRPNAFELRKPALDPSDIVRKCYRAGISERAASCSIVLSGQAPRPPSGAPKARGLTVKARIERSWMLPRMLIGSDIVREIEYQILHLSSEQNWCWHTLLLCVTAGLEVHVHFHTVH